MTAEVQIFVEQLEDALQIPIQGLYEHGGEMYTLVQRGPQSFRDREGQNRCDQRHDGNHRSADSSEGDEVVLNLREHLNLMDLPEVVAKTTATCASCGPSRRGSRSR